MTGVQTCALPICFPVTIRAINKQLAAQEKSQADFLSKLGSIGAIGYVPQISGSRNGSFFQSPQGQFKVK